ncbi:MAG: hypothetical protein AAF086_02110 [Planctomycetota bacterium]
MSIRPQDIPDAEEMNAVRDAATPPDARHQRRRRGGVHRVVRWSLRLAVGGVLLLALLVAGLPTLVSSGAGTSRVVDAINQRLPGRVEIDDLKLAWLKGQSLRGVRLYDPAGDVVGSIDEVRLEEVGLIGLLRGTRDLGIVVIEGMALSLVEDEQGRTNLDDALGTRVATSSPAEPNDEPQTRPPTTNPNPNPSNKPFIPADLRLAFALRDVKVGVKGPTLPDVRIEVPEATVTADGPAKLGFTLDATVAQGDEQGRVQIAGTAKNLFDSASGFTLSAAEFDVEGAVNHVPVAALDRLTQAGERWQTVIGPTLDAKVSLQGPTSALDALVTVTSENLNVHQAVTVDPSRIVAADVSESSLYVTPESWAILFGETKTQLRQPVRLVFRVDHLDAPLENGKLDLASTAYVMNIGTEDISQVILDVEDRGIVSFWLAVGLNSAQADDHTTLQMRSFIDAYGQQGPVSVVVGIRRGLSGWRTPLIEAGSTKLPMNVIDALLGQGERLATTFGDQPGLRAWAESQGNGQYKLKLDFAHFANEFDVPRLSGILSGTYSPDGGVSLKSEEKLRLTLTPEAFAAWMKPVAAAADMGESVGLSLPEATEIAADLDLEFALAEGPGLRFDPERTRAVAVIDLPETELVDEWYHRGFPLRNGTVRIDAPDLRQPVTANVAFETDTPDGDTGRLTADARLTGVMLDDGYIQIERGQLSGELELDRVPTVVFDALSRQQGYAVAAFGETVSADIDLTDWSFGGGGRVEFELSSANNSLASFSGTDRDGYFVPDAPITLFLNQTPELSNKILRFLNPILLPAVVSATVPMAVTIDDDSFRLPTRDFDLSLINADVRVQMGTISIVPNVSPVDKILPQLQTLGLVERASLYEARVSPIALAIRDGVFGYEDLSFKIDDVTLSFGGTISLVDQTIDMGMTLGGREIERDPLLQRLVGEGIKIGGTVQAPQVNLASVLNAFSQERLPQTLGGILQGVLKKELGRDQPEPTQPPSPNQPTQAAPDQAPADPAATPGDSPQAEPTIEEALGGLLGDFLNRELRRAQEKRQREQEPSE